MKNLISFLVTAFIFTSCSFYSGTVSTSLAPVKHQYSRIASGSSQNTEVLIFGSMARKSLVQEAKKNMYKNFPLEEGERYINMTVDFKTTYFLIGRKVRCSVSSDIISANEENSSLYSDEYLEMLSPNIQNDSLFIVGDTITGRDNTLYKILSFKTEDEAYLKKLDNSLDTLFSKTPVSITGLLKEFKGYQLDERLKMNGKTFIIKGFKMKKAVLLNSFNGYLYHYKYKKLDQKAARVNE